MWLPTPHIPPVAHLIFCLSLCLSVYLENKLQGFLSCHNFWNLGNSSADNMVTENFLIVSCLLLREKSEKRSLLSQTRQSLWPLFRFSRQFMTKLPNLVIRTFIFPFEREDEGKFVCSRVISCVSSHVDDEQCHFICHFLCLGFLFPCLLPFSTKCMKILHFVQIPGEIWDKKKNIEHSYTSWQGSSPSFLIFSFLLWKWIRNRPTRCLTSFGCRSILCCLFMLLAFHEVMHPWNLCSSLYLNFSVENSWEASFPIFPVFLQPCEDCLVSKNIIPRSRLRTILLVSTHNFTLNFVGRHALHDKTKCVMQERKRESLTPGSFYWHLQWKRKKIILLEKEMPSSSLNGKKAILDEKNIPAANCLLCSFLLEIWNFISVSFTPHFCLYELRSVSSFFWW